MPGDGRRAGRRTARRDVDSFVSEVHGREKQGASFGYTRVHGYHPLLATRADTGEVLHIRCRKGSADTSRRMLRFLDELIARVDRAGATGPKLFRADSGFWNKATFARLDRAGWQFSIGVRMHMHVRAAVEQVPEAAWTTLEDVPAKSITQIAETRLGGQRLIVRRVRTLDRQGQLLPSWEHYPFATNRPRRAPRRRVGAPKARRHRARDPRPQRPGPRALPLRQVHRQQRLDRDRRARPHPQRWTQSIGLPGQTVRAARTLRRRLLSMPGRLTRAARTWTLHLPARWPWHEQFTAALEQIRALPPPA